MKYSQFIIAYTWVALTPLLFVLLAASGYWFQYSYKTIFLDPILQDVETTQILGSNKIIGSVKGLSTDVQTADARPIILAEFLKKHDSPLQPYDYYGQFLTDLADKYELDYRLLPSISMQESNLCKKIPEGTYNCLGLGIHSKGTWGFDRYEDNFEAAAKILKKNYIDKGYVTPDEIQDKYTPGSNGSWEFAVNYFMDVLEYADF